MVTLIAFLYLAVIVLVVVWYWYALSYDNAVKQILNAQGDGLVFDLEISTDCYSLKLPPSEASIKMQQAAMETAKLFRDVDDRYGVGDYVTRDGTDIYLVIWLNGENADAGEFKCIIAPTINQGNSEPWIKVGETEFNLTRHYSLLTLFSDGYIDFDCDFDPKFINTKSNIKIVN